MCEDGGDGFAAGYANRNLRLTPIRVNSPVTSSRALGGSGTGAVDVRVQVPDAEALGIIGLPVGSATISIDEPPRWLSPIPLVTTPNAKDAPMLKAGFPALANHS